MSEPNDTYRYHSQVKEQVWYGYIQQLITLVLVHTLGAKAPTCITIFVTVMSVSVYIKSIHRHSVLSLMQATLYKATEVAASRKTMHASLHHSWHLLSWTVIVLPDYLV